MSLAKKQSVDFGDSWEETSALFLRLIELAPAERAAVLEKETAGKPDVRAHVQQLLASHEAAPDFMEKAVTVAAVPAQAAEIRPDDLPLGCRLDDFELMEVLGRGGFATVYKARQLSLSRIVALKVTKNEGHEARTVARLEHELIVPVFSETIFAPKNLRLICMPYVPGFTLERLLHHFLDTAAPKDGAEFLQPMLTDATFKAAPEREVFRRYSTAEAVIKLALDMVGALNHAHSKGLIHADIKPANILIHPDGRAFLVDFNVARNRAGSVEVNANPVGGTYEYMAPEQFDLFFAGDLKGGINATTPRSDIYSMGVVLKELAMATGLDEKNSPDLHRLLAFCTAPDPADRCASALDLAAALRGCLDLHQMHSAMPPSGWFAQFGLRRPLFLLTAGGFVIQFLASLVSTAYNQANLVSQLTVGQQKLFNLLLITYNPFCFVVGMSLWLTAMKRLSAFLKQPGKYTAQETWNLRQDVQRIPTWVFLLSFCSWMPGSLFFPFVIHLVEGPIPVSVFFHFILSFSLSCAIALAYGLLFADYVVFRCLYLRFWNPSEEVGSVARGELLTSLNRLKGCQLAVGWAPLLGALIIVAIGPGALEPERYRYFSLLVSMLLVVGITGIYFGIRSGFLLIDAYHALVNPKRH